MENVLDIKKRKNLNIILPKKHRIDQFLLKKGKCIIVVHLYYEETIPQYIRNYISNVPEEIDIIFTYSKEDIKKKIEASIVNLPNDIRLVYKSNRGRDISALLVACRKTILNYDFVCFLHDKKAKNSGREADNAAWVYSLWENMIGSSDYIYNILSTFSNHPQLGCLVPPALLCDCSNHAYTNQWAGDFELTEKLAQELGLMCDLNPSKSPITLGTVFWARVDAFKKLLEKEWRYEDFDEEPLKDDGTLSHAVERIFSFVAQDAGYETGWVMTDAYGGQYIDTMLSALSKAFEALYEVYGMKYISELSTYQAEREKMKAFCMLHDKNYIYGAGEYAAACYKLLKSTGVKIDGFVVTEMTSGQSAFYGLPIAAFKDIMKSEEHAGVLVAVNWTLQKEILQYLEKLYVKESDIYVFSRIPV